MPTNKIIHIRRLGIALAAAVALAPLVAQAQIYTTTPQLGGGSYTTGPNGWSAVTTPSLGGGSTTSVFQPSGPGMLPTQPFAPVQMQPLQPLTTLNPWSYR